MRNTYPPSILATILACTHLISPANAAARDRVFVASYGNDANPCTFGSPCKTFQQAVNVVASGGEVTAIDSAGFGSITISQAVTITSPPGVEAGIAAAAGADGIDIVAPGATVVLRGLTLLGANAANQGIFVSTAGRVEIIGCVVKDFKINGIAVQTSGSNTEMSVQISNTIVTDNSPGSDDGIFFISQAGGGKIIASLDHVMVSNSGIGIQPEAVSAPIEIMVTDSHIDNNTGFGIALFGNGVAQPVNMILKNVTFNQDVAGGAAIDMSGFSTVWLSQVTQNSVAGFTNSSIRFEASTTNNFAFSDGTNHLMGALGSGVTLGSWPSN